MYEIFLTSSDSLAVVPVLIGPLQVLIAILPALILSVFGAIIAMFKPKAIVTLFKLMWRQKIALVLIVGGIAGSIYLVRTYVITGPDVSKEVAGVDWPMFRGGMARSGANGTSKAPTTGGINWSFKEVKTFYASPALVGNRVYISSADKGPMRDKGSIFCLDADNGAVVWEKRPSGYLATFSSPSIAGKYLVVGEGLHYTKTARVICMDINQKGKVLWSYQTSSHVESTPCIDFENKRVYVGAGDDGYYCFNLEAAGDKQVIWHTDPKQFPDAETSPVLHDGRVFVGLGMGGNAIVCLDAETGKELWRTPTPYPVFSPPTVVDGLVIIGMGNGNFIETAEQVKAKELIKMRTAGKSEAEISAAEKTLGAAGEVWAVDEKSGELKWSFKAEDVILGAVAADQDHLYFGSRDGFLYRLTKAGKLREKWNANAPLLTSPSISNGYIYIVTETGMLYGLSLAQDLKRVWEQKVGFLGPFISSPAVSRGHIYVGSGGDGILSLGKPGDAKEAEVKWAGYAGGSGQGGGIDRQPLASKGKYAWRFPKKAKEGAMSITAPMACLNKKLYVPLSGERKGLICLEPDAKGKGAEELWFASSPNDVSLSPAVSTKDVFFVDGKPGDADRHLRCLKLDDGSEKWKQPVASNAPGNFVLTEQGVLIVDALDQLTAFDRSGNVKWRSSCAAEIVGMPAVEGAYIVVATKEPAVLVLDTSTGKQLGKFKLKTVPVTAPIISKRMIYLGMEDGLSCFDIINGNELWKTTSAMPSAPLVFARKYLAYTSTAGELLILNALTGDIIKTVKDVQAGIAPMVAPDFLVYVGKKGLMTCQATVEKTSSWMKSAWLGDPTCMPVMMDGRIYYASIKKGIVCLKSK